MWLALPIGLILVMVDFARDEGVATGVYHNLLRIGYLFPGGIRISSLGILEKLALIYFQLCLSCS